MMGGMDAPFVGTQVLGPDLGGEPTGWAVLSCHLFVAGEEAGKPAMGGWVAWLVAPGHPMLCVGDRAFASGVYRVVAPSPLLAGS